MPTLSKKTVALKTGASTKLTSKNTKQTVVWISSDEKLATVDAGKVSALGASSVTITATVDGTVEIWIESGGVMNPCSQCFEQCADGLLIRNQSLPKEVINNEGGLLHYSLCPGARKNRQV